MNFAARRVFALFGACGFMLVNSASTTGQDDARVNLTPPQSIQLINRVVTRLDGNGVVIPERDKNIKLRLDARLNYDERIIARKELLKSIRDYEVARAEIRLDDGSMINELADERRVLIAQIRDDSQPVQLAAIGSPFTQKEFELINVPANSLMINNLIEKQDVRVNDAWKPDTALLARFLNIDTIQQSDVELKLEALEPQVARIFIGGEVTGSIDDAGTQISISGVILFDRRTSQVTGCDLTFNQQRDISPMAPGLDATFRIAMRITPITTNPNLSNEGLAKLRDRAGSITNRFSLIPADGNIELLHPRAWRVIGEQTDRATLRLVHQGEMLGQCDIIPLPGRPSDKPQTLTQFREVVEAKLAENHPTITETDESPANEELQWMKVIASGSSEGVRLVWTYFTICHKDGRRVQLVFTTEPELSSRFDPQIDLLVSGIQFLPDSPAANVSFKK